MKKGEYLVKYLFVNVKAMWINFQYCESREFVDNEGLSGPRGKHTTHK